MSEQAPGYPQPDTPAVGGPDEGAAVPQGGPPATDPNDPYEKRYQEVQSWATRVATENADQRAQLQALQEQQELAMQLLTSEDEDTRRNAAEALGLVLPEEEQPADAYGDPFEPYDARLTALERRHAEQEQTQQEAEQARALNEVVSARLEEILPGAANDPDVKFDQDLVWSLANALPPTQEGLPDVDTAFQMLTTRNDRRQQAWAQSKRAPMFSPSGQTATEVPNLDNDQERQDYMTRRLMSNMEP